MLTWRLSSRQELTWHCWEDACVCYASPSGATQLVTVGQGFVLQQLQAGARTEPELGGLLEAEFDLRLGESATVLSDMLGELESMSLIEQTAQ